MPIRIVSYEQAFDLINVRRNDRINSMLTRLEREGRSERSISFSIWKSRNKLMDARGSGKFYFILENEIKKWSWNSSDPRWTEYATQKKEEEKALRMQEEENKRREIENDYRKKYPGYIYFIQGESGGHIKIGYTTNVATRLAGLQTGYPETLVIRCISPASYKDEARLHETFKEHRTRGEWFKPCEDIEAMIITINEWYKNHKQPPSIKKVTI